MSNDLTGQKAFVEDADLKVERAPSQMPDNTLCFEVDAKELMMQKSLLAGFEAAQQEKQLAQDGVEAADNKGKHCFIHAKAYFVEKDLQGGLRPTSPSSKQMGVEQQHLNVVEINPVLNKIQLASGSSQDCCVLG